MILVLKKNTTENEFNYILKKIESAGLKTRNIHIKQNNLLKFIAICNII